MEELNGVDLETRLLRLKLIEPKIFYRIWFTMFDPRSADETLLSMFEGLYVEGDNPRNARAWEKLRAAARRVDQSPDVRWRWWTACKRQIDELKDKGVKL